MTNPTGTKTKKTLIDRKSPPAEVRENTKARRAWLATESARLVAEGFETKIVGQGSYQTVSVYKVEQVEGRIQVRGECQMCGQDVALDGKRTSKHGYQRPGTGYIFGQCAGSEKAAIQFERTMTDRFLVQLDADVVANKKLEAQAEKAKETQWTVIHAMPEREMHKTEESKAAFKKLAEIEQARSTFRMNAWHAEQFAKHLRDNVLPLHGTDTRKLVIA